jgi:hypothetical protein
MNPLFRMKSSALALAMGLLTATALVAGPAMQLKPLKDGAAAEPGSTNAAAKVAKPKWQKLFDGKTLAGWSGLADHWKVEGGAITGVTTRNNPLKNNTFLVWTNGTVGNFELRLKYRIFNGNSGIQYRSQLMDAEKFIVGGYQADFEAGKRPGHPGGARPAHVHQGQQRPDQGPGGRQAGRVRQSPGGDPP